jgi:AraC-like DNA-binding protein
VARDILEIVCSKRRGHAATVNAIDSLDRGLGTYAQHGVDGKTGDHLKPSSVARAMIESGTHTPGVSPDDFGLPAHTALRYERPAPALCRHLTSYAVLDSEPGRWPGSVEWMLPGWAQIWIIMTRAPISVTIGRREYDPLPAAVLYGVTSRAMPVMAQGGVTIGIDVSPLGWARLFRLSAEKLRDQVTPLGAVMKPALVAELASALAQSDRARDVKGVLDTFFAKHMAVPHPDEAMIAQIMALIADDEIADLAAAADARGIDQRTVRRLSKRYFGFPPKLLMMRTRFIRTFLPLLAQGSRADHGAVPRGYHDRSHFLRDARRFLGMTPRRFIAHNSPYRDAALRARRLVIGSATPSFDEPITAG